MHGTDEHSCISRPTKRQAQQKGGPPGCHGLGWGAVGVHQKRAPEARPGALRLHWLHVVQRGGEVGAALALRPHLRSGFRSGRAVAAPQHGSQGFSAGSRRGVHGRAGAKAGGCRRAQQAGYWRVEGSAGRAGTAQFSTARGKRTALGPTAHTHTCTHIPHTMLACLPTITPAEAHVQYIISSNTQPVLNAPRTPSR